MLGDPSPRKPTEFDRQVFEAFVPRDHFLRKALEVIPWESFHELLAPFYSPDRGRPSAPPVLLLKVESLRYAYHLLDRQVIERSQTDMAFRYLLQQDVYEVLPDPSLFCLLRVRLGRDGFRKVFDQVVSVARERR